MEETLSVDVQGERGPEPQIVRSRMPLSTVLSFVVGLVGIAALGASAWVYSDTQREMLRLSAEIAQLRVSMDLVGQEETAPVVDDSAALTDLSNRLAIIEESWRNAPTAATPAALPTTPATTPAATADSGDCLPTGTRFMVAAGDRYPVCGTGAVVEIGSVDDGFISLGDGTVIAQGGNIALPNSACMIGVVPSDGAAISGYAEIKVTC